MSTAWAIDNSKAVSEALCFHCQSSVPTGSNITVRVADAEQPLCCTSCLAAVQFIHELKLDAYYQYRDQCGISPMEEISSAQPDHARLEQATTVLADGRRRTALVIPDLRCVACVWLLEQVLGRETGVSEVNVNYATRRLNVVYEAPLSASLLAERIAALGYSVRADVPDERREAFADARRSLLLRLGIAGIGMMQIMMFSMASYFSNGTMEAEYQTLMRWASLALTTPVVFYSAWPFHRSAWYALKNRTLIMDVPVSVSILAAWLLSTVNTVTSGPEVYFDTASMFTFFLLIGRFVELLSRHHFQQSQDLLEYLLPETAQRLRSSDAGQAAAASAEDDISTALSALKAGDLLRVQPGQTMPADGYVVHGSSGVSEAAFTGEPLPQFKEAGARVLAGSINHDGELIIRVKCAADEFVIRNIAQLQEQASSYRPRWAQLSDRISQWFVAAILSIAAGAALFWYQAGNPEFIVIALTVLVVACPCALSLATPVAYSIACTTLREAGVVIKHGAFLERAAATTSVVFDKTGTLTEASLSIDRVVPVGDCSAEECLALASALESFSEHPIALAFDAPHHFAAHNSEVVAGSGVRAEINGHHYRIGLPAFALCSFEQTQEQEQGQDQPQAPGAGHWILLSRDNAALAWFCLKDRVRADAADTVQTLQAGAISTAVLTGDRSMSAAQISAQFGVAQVKTSMSPADKVEALRQMQRSERVMMVGDGINDTAAMAAADTSLAVMPRDSFVQGSADAMLLGSKLMMVPRILTFARKCRRIIRQNVVWSVSYNLTVIPFALMGLVPPWMAALGMSMSSLLVVSNASRLRRMEH